MNNKGFWSIGPSAFEMGIILCFAVFGVWKFIEILFWLIKHLKWQS